MATDNCHGKSFQTFIINTKGQWMDGWTLQNITFSGHQNCCYNCTQKKNCCYNCSALLIEQNLKLKNVALNPTQSHVCNKCPPKWKLYQILFKVINLMTAQAVPNTERVHHYISITKTKTNAPLPGLTNFVFHQPPTHKRKRL